MYNLKIERVGSNTLLIKFLTIEFDCSLPVTVCKGAIDSFYNQRNRKSAPFLNLFTWNHHHQLIYAAGCWSLGSTGGLLWGIMFKKLTAELFFLSKPCPSFNVQIKDFESIEKKMGRKQDWYVNVFA